MRDELICLASLLRQRSDIDDEIAGLLGRPAHRGHVGEFIASRVFGIDLHRSASAKGHDGRFLDGPLAEGTVNVKFYARWEGLLDVHAGDAPPEHYLVLAGDGPRSWGIEQAFLFSHADLLEAGVRPGTAASVRSALSDAARIYPTANPRFPLTDAQRLLLGLFSAHP